MKHDKHIVCGAFTLAELLIVVAIIAVLVAIAIPIFNKQIEWNQKDPLKYLIFE